MTDFELLALNHEGFIPGPGEGEEEFLKRVAEAKRNFLEFPERKIPSAHWEWSALHVKELFDFAPAYLPAFYSNRSLTPWQGAASWIEGRALQAIQLREGNFFGLYRREEILAHEAVHGARSGFAESRSEEFFAYMTSEKKWRRVLGPILQRPVEAWPLLIALLGGCAGEFASIFFEWAAKVSGGCYLGAMVWLGLGFWRLIRGHAVLKRAGVAILGCVKDVRQMRAVLFRLTDAEIDLFSKGESLVEFALKQKCLRWRLIRLAYMKEVCYGSESDR